MTIQFFANNFELTTDLEKYANQKLARFVRRIPRKLRPVTICRVTFTQSIRKGTKFNTCDIVLSFENNELKTRETTQHMYAALDIAAVQIEQQLKDFVRRERNGLIRRYFRTS